MKHATPYRAPLTAALFASALLAAGPGLAQQAPDAETGATRLPAVSVTSTVPGDSTATSGYKPETARSTGPWGTRSIQDTPYSVTVVGSDLIQNTVATSTDQLFARIPSTQLNLNQSRGYGSIIYIRGLRLDSGFTELDGMRVSGDLIMPLEDKERVEVLSGLSGFLYGPGNAGGLVNYVLKRPTQEPLAELTLTAPGGDQYGAHADFGGPLDRDGHVAYRLNIAGSDGDTSIDHNHIKRWLVSGALDWHLTDDLLMQFDYSRQHYRETGTQADWGSFGGAFPHFSPDILDPSKNYSQKWTYDRNDLQTAGLHINYDVSDRLKLRAAYQHVDIDDENLYTGNNVAYANGAYSYSLIALRNAPRQHTDSTGYAFLDYAFGTGPIEHTLTFGFYGDDYRLRLHQDATQLVSLGRFAVTSAPQYVAEPVFTNGALPMYTSQITRNGNWVLGDTITFDERWSALLGVNRAEIDTRNFDTHGLPTSDYDSTKYTPSASLMYKPAPWVTFYTSYLESLQGSGTAAATFNALPVVNANQGLSPTVSKQYEVGAKFELGGSLLSAALFNLDKANTYYAPLAGGQSFQYTNDGRQRDRGLEVNTIGRVTPRLTLVGGIVLLDAEVTRTNTAYLKDAPPYGAARRSGKFYAEYDLPGLPGLTVTGGGNYIGPQLANAFAFPNPAAREWLPSYTTWDLGGRYLTRIDGSDTTFRLMLTNLTGKRYWQQSELIGAPRTLSLSVSVRLR